jgi:hypothetical protein
MKLVKAFVAKAEQIDEYPGFRYALPWAEFSYAFGVRPLS